MSLRACGFIAILWCVPCVSACLTSTVRITVRPDGSGHVEQTTLVRPAAVAEFERLTTPGAANSTTAEQLWADIQKRAQSTRVTERPLTAVKNGDMIGTFASYEVRDISALDSAVDLLPEFPGLGRFWGVASPDRAASTRLRMTLEPIADGLERLTVHFPRFPLDPSTEPPSAWASGSAAELAALKNVMSGARVTITIATDAPLLRTNSPFREGNRVTLVDADVADALFSKDVQRMAATPGTFDELLSWYATVPGVTLAPDHDVTLDIQNPSTQNRPAAPPPPASQPSMDTEVFVATLAGAGSTLAIGPPINISNNPGYDNQPSFSPDGEQIFFASTRGTTEPARDPAARQRASLPSTDIYRYEIASRRMVRITQTPESEFSPTVMPDGTHLSMIRVEADGAQHLCSVEPATVPKRETSVVLPNVKPVGYHAWIDARRVAVYVLGESGQPSTLQIATLQDGRTQTIASNIGRSLQRMPSGSISFVQRETTADGGLKAVLSELDTRSMEIRSLVKPAAGITDPYVTWMPDGTALMAAGFTIYRWRAGDAGWSVVAHLDGFGLRDVTRLAASSRGDRLALVAQK
jgi:WD40-like Beta Propeller Repeat